MSLTTDDLTRILTGLPAAVVVVDRDLRVVAATDRYLADVRKTRADLVGRNIIEAFTTRWSEANPLALQRFRESLDTVFAEGRAHRMEVQRFDLKRAGSDEHDVRYWKPLNVPVLDEQGEVRWVVHSTEDITEAVRSEETFRLLAEHSADKISRVDTDAVYLYVSPAAERVTGWAPAELVGRPVADFWHPDDRPRIQHIIDTLRDGQDVTSATFRYRHKDGRYVWLENTSQAIRDPGGALVEIQSASRDVTARLREEALLRTLAANIPDASIFLLDQELRILLAQGEMIRRVSWGDERVFRGKSLAELHGIVPEELLATSVENYTAVLRTGERREFDFDDGGVHAHVTATPITGQDGSVESVLVFVGDVSLRRAAELRQRAAAEIGELALTERDLPALVTRAVEIVSRTIGADVCDVLMTRPDDRVRVLAFTGEGGLEPEQELPAPPGSQAAAAIAATKPIVVEDLASESGFTPAQALLDEGVSAGVMIPLYFREESLGCLGCWWREPRAVEEAEVDFLVAVASLLAGVIEHHRELELSRHAALHDALTGLPNRSLGAERIELALSRRRREGRSVGVLVLDIDRFKVINDSLGHAAGDELLVAMADRLSEAMRASDTVARLSGDEFAVICESDPDLGPRGVIAVAERVLEALARPFSVSTGEHYMSASVGIAIAAAASDTADSLLRDADAAMYRAKGGGPGRYEVFDDEMRAQVLDRLRVESDLRRAIHHDELRLHYQPIMDLATGRPVGAEALVRWEHPERGLLAPAAFVAIAEETGMIVELGRWVLEAACRQAAEWQRSHGDFTIWVNVSGGQLSNALFPAEAAEVARRHGLAPGTVQLEVTESVLLAEADAPQTVLDSLRGLGLRLVLDDFGTGFSSLSYLKSFELDGLKIDRSFVQDLGSDRKAAAITRAVVELSRELGMSVTAEGIETEDQLDAIRRLGCQRAQGYLFARPQPPEEFTALLTSGRSAARARDASEGDRPGS